ncbi:hypothetical protein NP233_g6030 [Leucocoprinus birnbaumii]|uniref:Monopolin complex subunit Csm1/Pcs1 C-terminal domain-containing protein n=1 Tax=Leucocoprinus birnbaumii TaxID=56174 RepID=A0AAD5VRT9_9AGAR|nr:hypothetical protein NP233_g6030 [Leucocoprinus birnbaumii]
MSDDSVEFGGFGPTTPAAKSMVKPKPRARTTAKPLTKQRLNGADHEPGPSKRANGNATSRPTKRKKAEEEIVVESQDEDEDVDVDGAGQEMAVEDTRVAAKDVVVSSDDDEVRAEIEKQVNGNGTKTRARTNGRTQPQRGKPPSASRQQQKPSKKEMEVQGSEEEDALDEVVHIPPPQEMRIIKAGGARGKGQVRRKMDVDEVAEEQSETLALIDKLGKASGRHSDATGAAVKDAELARLKEKIGRLENDNKKLSEQMEELFRIRETEAEALLRRTEEQYQARVRALEEINQTLTEQLSKKQPLAGLGKSSSFNFIPRETAEAEKQTLDKEIARLKAQIDDTAKKLKDKDSEIGDLKQTEKELRFELKAEIDRASALAKQTTRQQPTPRSGLAAEDPKHREAIKLYEDLTNIIVLNIRSSPSTGAGKKDEWQFTCCYTHTNESDAVSPITRSLSFTLRSYEQPDDDDHLSDWIQYLPTSLDTETEEFRNRLGFLASSFQFERNQLALFLRTLYTTVEDIVKGSEESEDGDK